MSLLKLIWVNYGRLDPLGKGYVGNRVGAAAIESEFGSDLEIFTEVENCWRRDYIEEGDAMPSVLPSVIEDRQERQSDSGRKISSSRSQSGRSTGPVDRRAQHAQEWSRSTGRSTAGL